MRIGETEVSLPADSLDRVRFFLVKPGLFAMKGFVSTPLNVNYRWPKTSSQPQGKFRGKILKWAPPTALNVTKCAYLLRRPAGGFFVAGSKMIKCESAKPKF